MSSRLVVPLLLVASALLMLGQADKPERFKAPSEGCISCHGEKESMHPEGWKATCVGCHGGNGKSSVLEQAHVLPSEKARDDRVSTSANRLRAYGDLMSESAEYVKFINPGDLRIVEETCGECHPEAVNTVKSSIMAHSANVPAAGLYNNGHHPSQVAVYGEAFTRDGKPASLHAKEPLTEEQKKAGALSVLRPLARWEATASPDPFRLFERGNNTAGTRDRGTDFKVSGVYLGLAKIRLNDPYLWLPGTNEGPGDYRASGCSACHVIYANETDPAVAGPYAKYGNRGFSATGDVSIPRGWSGHPIKHQLTTKIPASQCLTCHHHQGNGALHTYGGYIWHDQETEVDILRIMNAMPSQLGQKDLSRTRSQFRQMQFSGAVGHGWNFRAVYWRDKEGRMIPKTCEDADLGDPEDVKAKCKPLKWEDPEKFEKGVHLRDIHLDAGMHCIDCHTRRDVHGDGFLYGAMIDAVEIGCVDCHGTATKETTLTTTGAAAGSAELPRGTFRKRRGKVTQKSKMNPKEKWTVPQLVNASDPGHDRWNERAARAHGMRTDGTWGPQASDAPLAHPDSKIQCYSCHSSWNTSCWGCHLSADANSREKEKHAGLGESRVKIQYNPQVIRADAYTLGINGTKQGNRVSPIRSASGVVISLRDLNRDVVVNQQPTVSSSGLSGHAVTANTPHTVRKRQTKTCSDCHLSRRGNNNAAMAMVLGQGTNAANWMADWVYVSGDRNMSGVRITEGDEPRPVIGSDFHAALHPASSKRFARKGRKLNEFYGAKAKAGHSIAVLGEFALVADGTNGLVVYDIANVANKGVPERVVRAPFTFFGQTLRVRSKDARWVALASGLPMDPTRDTGPERTQPTVAPVFHHAYVADFKQGLIVVDTSTLVDGNPANNRLKAAVRFNPNGWLTGAVHIAITGNHALVSTSQSLVVVDISKPQTPSVVKRISMNQPRAVAVQFRYAFVADNDGVKVLDVTEPAKAKLVKGASVSALDVRGLTAYRTHLIAAAGATGLMFIDITRPRRPKLADTYNAGGALFDTYGVTIGSTNASTFAYVADGSGGLKVVSLVEPARVHGHLGFSPPLSPKVIATFKPKKGQVRAVADGIKRDRYVDEAGQAISVGSRIGSRPLSGEEMKKLYVRKGKVWTVLDHEKYVAPAVETPAPTPVAPTPTPTLAPTPTATPPPPSPAQTPDSPEVPPADPPAPDKGASLKGYPEYGVLEIPAHPPIVLPDWPEAFGEVEDVAQKSAGEEKK